MSSSKDRVAVVTGGGRGIGRGIVVELAGLGFSVVVNYRSDVESARLCCELAEARGAPEAIADQADIADPEQGRGLVRRSLDRFGRIDLWVNNAGVAPQVRADLLDTSPDSWDRLLTTNLRGPFFATQAVAREMIRIRQSAGLVDYEPRIIFITSISSTHASVNRGEYCVAKAGLSMVSQLFALRLADEGIRVHEIRPGIIDTEMTRPVHDTYSERIAGGLAPIRRWGTPEDVGRAVAGLASGMLPFSTGDVLHIDGGLHIRVL